MDPGGWAMANRRIGRRPLLRGAVIGAAGLVGLAGCDDDSTTKPAPSEPTGPTAPTGLTARTGPTDADWKALASDLDGTLRLPDQAEFAAAAQLYDPRWDGVQPAAVVEATPTAPSTRPGRCRAAEAHRPILRRRGRLGCRNASGFVTWRSRTSTATR